MNPVFEHWNVEVDEQAEFAACYAQVRKDLRRMNRCDTINGFQFYDDHAVYQHINPS